MRVRFWGAKAEWIRLAGILLAGELAACVNTRAGTMAERAEMVETIEAYLDGSRRGPGVPARFSERVLAAMRAVPRHEFVPKALRGHAYADTPLDIGEGQTISQPFMVALMTELSGAGPGSTVLEIGTGSGYQAAILSHLGADVHSIEIEPALAKAAAERLTRLGYDTVKTRVGDGYAGWPEPVAPFDAIIVTAAPDHVPKPLVEQLAEGGRLVIPVGPLHGPQELVVITKDAQGALSVERVTGVRFVPLTRTE